MAARKPRFQRIKPEERKARLIEASISCLAAGGIQGFTVDAICREAGTSRGLIVHHFGSKDALLAAVYAEIYSRLLQNLESIDPQSSDLGALIETVLSGSFLNREYLNVWLALWGEIAVNPHLQAEHRKHYALFRERISRALSTIARARGVTIDSYEIATMFISLTDGLWLEQCIDSSVLSTARAKEVCHRVLEAALAGAFSP
jgi:AcrR family transcriptional regulator